MVRLGSLLGQGGEGTVHSVQNDSRLAAKIYLPGLASERRNKITKMVDAKLHASADFVTFPIDTLFDASGVFSGFTMLKMGGRAPVHQLYGPTSRKSAFPRATYPLLVRAASNVARALASVHASGCVVGDINHSGVLVSDDATVVLIDSDSFQFSHAGQIYPCKVGVPEFTPPELQGKSLSKIVRTANHDAFGLTVLVFYTLMMGRHPFAGRYRGSGDMPMDKAISEFRFAYSVRRAATKMEPPPNVPTLADLPPSLSDAFERAFRPEGATSGRLSATEWVGLLDRAEAELVPCAQASAHHYFRSAPSCPWCRMERAYPGFRAFAPKFAPHAGGAPLNLGQLIAAVRGVADPGPAPDITSLMPAVAAGRFGQPLADLRKARLARRAAAIVGGTIGLACLNMPAPGPVIGLLVLVASSVLAFKSPAGLAALDKSVQQARLCWQDAKRAFEQTAGNDYFLKVRKDGEALIQELQQIAAEETRRLADLIARQREAQLRRHLEFHDVDQVKINGVGAARKLTLKSYGIETAWDVSYQSIVAIPGFGPSIANNLLAWRGSVEALFQFDPSRGVNPLDVAAIKAEIAQRNADTESRLQNRIALLRKASSDALFLRSNPGKETIEAWAGWKRTESYEKELSTSPRELAPLVVLAIGGMFALTTLTHLGRLPRGSAGLPVPSVTSPTLRAEQPRSLPTAAFLPPAVPPPTTSDPGMPATPALSVQAAPTIVALPTASPLPAPLDVRTIPSADTIVSQADPPAEDTLNLLNSIDASRVQKRLKLLGYFGGIPEGFWGSKSRAALRDFRRTQGLGNDDRWDAQTESILMSDRAIRAGNSVQIDTVGPEVVLPPPLAALRNPLNKPDALWAQGRLNELGFYSGGGDGAWGLTSRTALRNFKVANGLPSDDTWDAATEQRLAGEGQIQPNQAFVGGWASKLADCGNIDSTPPVLISPRRAEAFGGACEFENLQRHGSGWHIQGQCTSDGKSWRADIQLTLNGSTLTWSSQRGVAKYVRCR